jgi:hypothetical protein
LGLKAQIECIYTVIELQIIHVVKEHIIEAGKPITPTPTLITQTNSGTILNDAIYSAVDLPEGLMINSSTGVITGVMTSSGNFTYKIVALSPSMNNVTGTVVVNCIVTGLTIQNYWDGLE